MFSFLLDKLNKEQFVIDEQFLVIKNGLIKFDTMVLFYRAVNIYIPIIFNFDMIIV
jgi:hypothetical protein